MKRQTKREISRFAVFFVFIRLTVNTIFYRSWLQKSSFRIKFTLSVGVSHAELKKANNNLLFLKYTPHCSQKGDSVFLNKKCSFLRLFLPVGIRSKLYTKANVLLYTPQSEDFTYSMRSAG